MSATITSRFVARLPTSKRNSLEFSTLHWAKPMTGLTKGRYDLYLDAARRNDDYIRRIWETAQSMPRYAGKTSLILTTDHGRGDGREGWKNHSALIPGSDRIWIAVMGPDTPADGVIKTSTVTQSQVAATLGALLGEDFSASDSRIAKPLDFKN